MTFRATEILDVNGKKMLLYISIESWNQHVSSASFLPCFWLYCRSTVVISRNICGFSPYDWTLWKERHTCEVSPRGIISNLGAIMLGWALRPGSFEHICTGGICLKAVSKDPLASVLNLRLLLLFCDDSTGNNLFVLYLLQFEMFVFPRHIHENNDKGEHYWNIYLGGDGTSGIGSRRK